EPTPSAVAPISTSKRATSEDPPPAKRTKRTDATGALIKQGNPLQKTVLFQAALHKLPDELLLQIAGLTGPDGEGVDLNLRSVSKQMKVIADDQLSPKQRFLMENGPTLHAAGHSATDMLYLAGRPEDRQNFVVTHGQTLHAAGHSATDMLYLAGRPEDRQNFVLTHGQTLHAAGHSAEDMLYLAGRPEDRQNFVVTHGQTLHAAGHSAEDMLHLAGRPEDRQNFVVTHGQTLHAAGHSATEMLFLPIPA
ncbi:hypothetical protein EAH72_35030, partial [Pseudomonas caspiana]